MEIIQNRFLNLLRIQPKETGPLFFSFFYAALVGAFQTFAIIAPLSLFLITYSSLLLPYIYIALAITILSVSNIYSFFEKKLALSTLISWILFFAAISLLLFWALLYFYFTNWLTFALVVWGWVLFGFGNIIVSCLMNSLFTLEQGKRIYGLIGGGQGLGGILAGLSTPLLVRMIGNIHLVLFTACLSATIIIIVSIIKKRYLKHQSEIHEAHTIDSKKKSFWKLLKNRYIQLVFIFAAFNIFEYYALDMLFNTTLQLNYPDEIQLTSFLGYFFSAADAVNLVLGIFFFRWLLEKGGVIISLLLTPLIVGALIIIAWILHRWGYSAVAIPFFGLIILSRLMDEGLRVSVYEQTLTLLFQPLKPLERAFAYARVELWIVPIATGTIGCLLLVMNQFFSAHLNVLMSIIIVFCVLGIILLLPIKKQYIKSLTQALEKRRIQLIAVDSHQPTLQSAALIALTTLDFTKNSEFILSYLHFSAIEKIKSKKIFFELIKKLESKEINKIHYNNLIKYRGKIYFLIKNNFNVLPRNVKLHLVMICQYIPSTRLNKLLRQHLSEQDVQIRHAILDALDKHQYKASTPNKKRIAAKRLQQEKKYILALHIILSTISSHHQARLLAYFIIREIELSRRRIFIWLSFCYKGKSIMHALHGLDSSDESLKSYGLELLLTTLSTEDQHDYLAILTNRIDIPSKQDNPELIATLHAILDVPERFYFPSYIQAAVIYTTKIMQLDEFDESIRSIKSDDKILAETISWAKKLP